MMLCPTGLRGLLGKLSARQDYMVSACYALYLELFTAIYIILLWYVFCVLPHHLVIIIF